MTSNDDTTRPVTPTATTGPTAASAAAPAQAPGSTATAEPVTSAQAPTYIEGPAPFPILLGVLGVLLAGGVLISELTDLSLPWTDLGPWTAVIVGLVVLVVGAIGLSSSRRQD